MFEKLILISEKKKRKSIFSVCTIAWWIDELKNVDDEWIKFVILLIVLVISCEFEMEFEFDTDEADVVFDDKDNVSVGMFVLCVDIVVATTVGCIVVVVGLVVVVVVAVIVVVVVVGLVVVGLVVVVNNVDGGGVGAHLLGLRQSHGNLQSEKQFSSGANDA